MTRAITVTYTDGETECFAVNSIKFDNVGAHALLPIASEAPDWAKVLTEGYSGESGFAILTDARYDTISVGEEIDPPEHAY